MHQEKYDLNWHKYSEHLREMLHGMMKSNELTDVTLVCDDKTQFKAHKIVLSACSSVFKSIINDVPQSSSIIYLRGIQHQEMNAILEFMYLGVATFYQERMNEFLNVAKDLEIKEISKNVEFNKENIKIDKPELPSIQSTRVHAHYSINDRDMSDSSDGEIRMNESQFQKKSDGMFICDQCESQFTEKIKLIQHIQSIHEGVRYACNQCDYQATRQYHLKTHILSFHEGVRYACNKCDFQATRQDGLKMHIKSIHEGVKYACNQCDHQAADPSNLRKHIKNKH